MKDNEFMKQRCCDMSIKELEKAISIKKKNTLAVVESGQVWQMNHEFNNDYYLLSKVDVDDLNALFTLQHLGGDANRYYEPMPMEKLKDRMEKTSGWRLVGKFNDVFRLW